MQICIIGGGAHGEAAARLATESGHQVVLIEEQGGRCEELAAIFPKAENLKIVCGRGFVSSVSRVVVLNPLTGDEKQPLNCDALIISCGVLHREVEDSRFLGLRKLGVLEDSDGRIQVNGYGHSGIGTIYALGSCSTNHEMEPEKAAAMAVNEIEREFKGEQV